jgi:hypothetical protein
MRPQTLRENRYSCGQHVAGRGRQVSAPGQAAPWRNDYIFEKGVIVMTPGKNDEHYTVFDEQTYAVFKVKEENLTPIP